MDTAYTRSQPLRTSRGAKVVERATRMNRIWRRSLASICAIALVSLSVLGAPPEASALDNDEFCNPGEVCLSDWHNGAWQVWSNQNDINAYFWFEYAVTGMDLNERSNVVRNAGVTCDVTVYAGSHYFGDELTVSNDGHWHSLDGSVGIDKASSHDFCAT